MSSLAKNFRAIALVAGFIGASAATTVHASSPCGVTGVSGQGTSIVYDPFDPSGLSSTTVMMRVSRVNPKRGGKTDAVNFYLSANDQTGTEANGIKIVPVSVTRRGSMAGRSNIFYDEPVTNPPTSLMMNFKSTPPSGSNSYVQVKFNGDDDDADDLLVTFSVTIPANLNLNASRKLAFDANYACSYSGGGKDNDTVATGSTASALVFPVTILSALRTYYAGTALDFGEIGLVTSADFASKNTGDSNYVYVQSSGAYDITLSSQNGFALHNTNGVTGDNDKVKYKLDFLGTPLSSATSPTPGQIAITKRCIRAGLASESKQLPIKATLMEAGAGKNPANYLDNLTVTLTPKAYGESGVVQCGS